MGEPQTLTPDRLGRVQALRPESSGSFKLTPETEVLCIHRGANERVNGKLVRARDGKPELQPYRDETTGKLVERHPRTVYVGDYTDQFDGRHYIIPPGYFTIEFGAAAHFKARAVVPGSRNTETGFQASFIAILGAAVTTPEGLRIDPERQVDDVAEWDPFTDEERREYGMAVEAIDRASLVDPIESDVVIVPTMGAANEAVRSRVKANAGGRSNKRTDISDPAGVLKTRNAPGENEAIRESRAAAAAVAAGGDAE